MTAGQGFTLTVPASWFELELRPQARDGAVDTLVRERLRDQPDLAPHRPTITRLLRRQSRLAWEAGAVYCACMVEPTDEGPITGAVTVCLVDAPVGAGVTAADRSGALLERLQPKVPSGPDDTWTRVETVQVEGAGTCPRTAGVEDVDLPDGGRRVRSVLLQTFVPLPGQPSVLLLSCSSPVLPLADVLLDLFDAISSTLRVTGADGAHPADGRG